MENSNTDKSLFDISFDETVKQNLKGAATWAGIAAFVSLIGSILGLVNYFIAKQRITRYDGFEGIRTQQVTTVTGFVSVAISLIIGIILFVFLNKFSMKSKAGVDGNDQYLINVGLASLSTYFKFIGVLLIIIIVIAGLVFMIGVGQNV